MTVEEEETLEDIDLAKAVSTDVTEKMINTNGKKAGDKYNEEINHDFSAGVVQSSSKIEEVEEEKTGLTKNSGNPTTTQPLSATTLDSYHPSFMFCGECTTCGNPPPPPLSVQKQLSLQHQAIDSGEMIELTALDETKTKVSSGMSSTVKCLPVTSDPSIRRSEFLIPNLSSSSQTLAINSLVQPLPGVHSIHTNLEKKLVVVYHNPFDTPANMISLVLTNRGYYDVTILSDGGSSLSNTEHPSGICKSVLRVVEGLCCNSEIPTLEKMLADMDGVVKMTGISIATKTLYFEHDPFIITVKEVAKALTKEGFRSIVKRDGARQQYKQPLDEVATKEVKKPATPTANYAFWSNQESDGFGTEESLPTVSSPSSRSVETAQYVESTLRIGKLSSLKHIKSMESAFKKANSQMRREAGKKRMVC